MKTLLRSLSFLLLACAGPAFAVEMTIHRDLAYAEPKNERQCLDVYAPAKPQGAGKPVVVWIHGGGWQRGDKSTLAIGKPEQQTAKPQAIVDRGGVFVAINYRFIPNVDLKTMMSDVAKAIKWVKSNVAQYGGDPGAIMVMGHSAGAQMAALVCTDERYLKAEGLTLQDIKGCMPVDGDSYYPRLQIETVQPKYAASYRLKFPEASERELSSVLHVAKDKGIPPFTVLCVKDHPESGAHLQSEILAHQLLVAGVNAKVVPVPGKTHATLNADLGVPGDEGTKAMLAFIEQMMPATLSKSGPGTWTLDGANTYRGSSFPAGVAGVLAFEMAKEKLDIHLDIPYAEPKGERQCLDVYTRKGEASKGAKPVVVWIHGGGWRQGDKSTLAVGKPELHLLKPTTVTDRCGGVFVAINYRFIPNVDLKTMAGDVAKAIAWVKRNVAQYGGDPDSIVVMGHSAGAQLAALVCTDESYLKAEGLTLRDIKGCVPVDGASFYVPLQVESASPEKQARFRPTFPEGREVELSSVLHVAKDKGIPPFLLLCLAENPGSNSFLQSNILAHYLQLAGVSAKVVGVHGKTHPLINSELGFAGDPATEAMVKFLEEHVKVGKGE